jgi:copper transport protein
LLYAGLALLVGAAIDARLVFRSGAGRSLLGLALAGLAAAVVGTVGLVCVQLLDAGVDLGTAARSSIGAGAAMRLAPLLIAGIVLMTLRERGLLIAGVAAVAGIVVTAFLGHAGAGDAPLLNTAIDALHLLAASVWIGGLAGLLVGLRAIDSSAGFALRQFARTATIGLAVVVATGVLRAAAELTTLSDLWTTDFGRLLLLKTGLVGIVAMLGAVNHFRHVPRGSVSAVRRNGTFEVGLASLALLATAALVDLAPPVQVAAASVAAQPPRLVADGADYATTLRMELVVSPGLVGFNRFDANLSDYDAGTPLDANGITLRFGLPLRPDIPGSTLRLNPTSEPGSLSGTGANLGLSGRWSITALVDRGVASVEVPLQVRISPPLRPIDVDREPGVPTIYTEHLDGGYALQVYFDPGTAGPNDVHATFFAPDGNGLAATAITEFVSDGNGGGPGLLVVRTLEPGHVVGSTPLTSGTYQVEVTAMTPDGTPIDAVVPVTVT